MIDPDSGVPVYRQLVDLIRKQIDSGELRPGQRLRTEPEYIDEFGLGRDSVRLAMATLRAEGLIITTKQGSKVRPVLDMAEVAISKDTQVSTRMPTVKERRLLGLPEGVPVIVVERPGSEPEVLAGDRTRLIVG
jgi:DNA-binding GntR family transcriptional regulator